MLTVTSVGGTETIRVTAVTMAALGQEVARSTSELKAAFEQGLEEILSAGGGDQKEAIFKAAAMIGGVVVARAVQNPQFSNEILMSVRQKLSR